MKGLVYSILAFALISAGLTITYSHIDNTQTVSVSIDNPERAVKAVGSVLTEIDGSLQSFSEPENDSADSDYESKEVFYRIRDLDYDPVSQIGSYENYDNAIRACVPGYCIYDQDGALIYANAAK